MANKRIYLCLAHMSEAGLEQKYIQEAFDTNWVGPLGPNVNGFEKDLVEFVGENKRVVALSAGTAAPRRPRTAPGICCACPPSSPAKPSSISATRAEHSSRNLY